MRELWILNPGIEDPACPVAPRSGRFLKRSDDGKAWVEVPVRDGAVRSSAVEGLVLELDPFWKDCGL